MTETKRIYRVYKLEVSEGEYDYTIVWPDAELGYEVAQDYPGGEIYKDGEWCYPYEMIGSYDSLKRAWFAARSDAAMDELWRHGDPRLHPWYTKLGIDRKGGIIL